MKFFINLLLTLATYQNSYFVNYIEFEKLLGKQLPFVEEIIGSDFENKLFNKNFYYLPNEFVSKHFLGMQYHNFTILTNENEIVQSITIHFREVINRQFYDFFVERYNMPKHIQVIKSRDVISEGIYEKHDFSAKLRKSEVELREGVFEDKPLFIIWEKEGYQIKAFMRHKQKMSEITFRVPMDKF